MFLIQSLNYLATAKRIFFPILPSQRRFWTRVQNEIGIVPDIVRNVLDLLGYTATEFFGDFSEADIQEIQEEMRTVGLRQVQKLLLDESCDKNMEDYFGVFENGPENFVLTKAQIRSIKNIVDAIKSSGVGKYINESQIVQSDRDELKVQHSRTADEEIKIILTKLQRHYHK